MQSLSHSIASLTRIPSFARSIRTPATAIAISQCRLFSSSSTTQDWLRPKGDPGTAQKGRPQVHTGGSVRGTTVVWGDYGMRLKDHHRRLSAMHLKNAEEAIKKKLRGMKYRLYMRVACNIPVYTKGNEVRMGTGKGSHDFWAARVPVSRIIFELKGVVHEQIVKEAFRLAGDKMPGIYEFVKKGDYPVMGVTKLTPEAVERMAAKKYKFMPSTLVSVVPATIPKVVI
ncbi:39S ribosomal protein L16, mitochondrial [Maublancomyces gigas]|uniref:39S ribosomal protein L16, mitochondrial n=1 Tax=Discina gigas TaxID=1032678 RepID=A0ABR3GIG7_9PEZI